MPRPVKVQEHGTVEIKGLTLDEMEAIAIEAVRAAHAEAKKAAVKKRQ